MYHKFAGVLPKKVSKLLGSRSALATPRTCNNTPSDA